MPPVHVRFLRELENRVPGHQGRGHHVAVRAAGDVARAPSAAGRPRSRRPARPGCEGGRSHRHRGRCVFRGRATHPPHAESRLPRRDERHRLARAALRHPVVHAHCAPGPLGRAVSVAHARRHRHRGRSTGVEHPVRIRARSEGSRAADPRSLHVLAKLAVAGRAAPHARPDGGGAVKRAECIAMLYPELDDKAVVTIMGACAQELYDLGHKENFFYLQHAMGLASSIGLGLALHLPHEKIVVLDGDGSVLMNLGTLATLARYRPRNLVHFIFDNGSLLPTGGYSSHTTTVITDLAAIARGAVIEHVTAVDSVMAFGEAAIEAFARNDLSVIVARVAAVGPNHYGMDLQLPENAFRFKRWIASRKSAVKPRAAAPTVAARGSA